MFLAIDMYKATRCFATQNLLDKNVNIEICVLSISVLLYKQSSTVLSVEK